MNATRPASGTPGSRSLRPGELAQSSVMAALCAATAIISIISPFAGALSLLGTVPMGLLAYRYRFRVLIAATVAAGLIAFLIAGLGGLMTGGNSAYVGGATGGRETPGPRHRDHRRGVLLRRGPVQCLRGRGVGAALTAAAPDLRCDHRQRQRCRGCPAVDRAFR